MLLADPNIARNILWNKVDIIFKTKFVSVNIFMRLLKERISLNDRLIIYEYKCFEAKYCLENIF